MNVLNAQNEFISFVHLLLCANNCCQNIQKRVAKKVLTSIANNVIIYNIHICLFCTTHTDERGYMEFFSDTSVNSLLDNDERRAQIIKLIKMAQDGSEEAFFELKKIYDPLIEGRVSKNTLYEMTADDIEDLRGEALVQFCRAVCNYDLSVEGVEFGLFAKICVDNGLKSFIRSYNRRKHKIAFLLNGEPGEQSSYGDLMQDVIDRENLSALVGVIQGSLSEYESRVWWLYASGISVAEIAKKLHAPDAKSVSNAIYRIRKKLRSKISEIR